jgi:hypothetical protein
VFMDVTDIEAGVDFVDVLQRAVGSCDVLLAVMGRAWLSCTDRQGRRRLDDPRDFIRLEIGTALTRNVRVIPVLVEGAPMPGIAELPPELEGLTRRQAVELRDTRWVADVDSLAAVLDHVLGRKPSAKDEKEEVPSHPARKAIWAAAAALIAAVAVAAVILLPRISPTPSADKPDVVSPGRTLPDERPAVQTTPPPAAATGTEVKPNPPAQSPAAAATTPAVPTPTTPVVPTPTLPEPGAADTPPSRPPPSQTAGSVLVQYASDNDRQTAEDLAAQLRDAINDPRYVVRALPSRRNAGNEGTVLYSAANLSTLAGNVAVTAGPWLTKQYNHRVSFAPTIDARIAPRSIVLVMPGKSPAAATRVADPVVTIVFPATDDTGTAEELATFLRTRPNQKYQVRTVRATTGPRKEGQIEYDNQQMAAVAQTLARDAAAWISRAYRRPVVLQPTLTGRIGANAVVLWLPAR